VIDIYLGAGASQRLQALIESRQGP
jgi:hypothetical protein